MVVIQANVTVESDFPPVAGLAIGWINLALCCLEFLCLIVLLKDVPDYDENQRNKVVYSIVYLVNCLFLSVVALDLLASILLIIGALEENHFLLIPWLITHSMMIPFKMMSGVALCVSWSMGLQPQHNRKMVVYLILNPVLIVIHTVMLICIAIMFEDIEEEN